MPQLARRCQLCAAAAAREPAAGAPASVGSAPGARRSHRPPVAGAAHNESLRATLIVRCASAEPDANQRAKGCNQLGRRTDRAAERANTKAAAATRHKRDGDRSSCSINNIGTNSNNSSDNKFKLPAELAKGLHEAQKAEQNSKLVHAAKLELTATRSAPPTNHFASNHSRQRPTPTTNRHVRPNR